MNYIYNMLFSGIYGIVLGQQHEITLNYTALRLPYSQLLTASGDTRYLKPWSGGRPSMENSWRTGMLAVVVLQNKFLLIDQFALTFTVVSQLRFDLTLPILQYFLTLLYQLFQYAYFFDSHEVIFCCHPQYTQSMNPKLGDKLWRYGTVIWTCNHVSWGISSILGDKHE